MDTTEGKKYYAVWTPADDTPFTVEVYVLAEGQNAYETYEYTGTTGSTVKVVREADVPATPEAGVTYVTIESIEEDLEYYNGTVYLYLPVGHFKGLENITAKVDGKDYIFELSENGIRIELDMANLQAGQIINYSVSYTTSGAQYLKFNPNSGTFKVNLSSKYTSPSFNGTFLPNERTIDDNGFKAEWTVTKFNTYGIDYKTFYVEFIVPVTQYQQATRATKYSFLIILLVFTAIFLVEVISRQEVNYIQYIVTGFSLCLFYLLLLSISEYLAFGWAYLIASGMTVLALGGYFIGFLRSKTAVGCTVAVAILYAFIYMLLNLETGSLLVGSLALFVILSLIMYFTRKNNLMDSPSDEVMVI
jgi:inner membrane protein